MNEVIKDVNITREATIHEPSIYDMANEACRGWTSEDLQLVKSSAESIKSRKMASRIKAVAKVAALNRQCERPSQSFAELLFTLNPSNKLIRENRNYLVVEVAANFRLPKLPLGYGFKGGAARIALSHLLGNNTRNLIARDFDVVRFSKGNIKQDNIVAARVMPEDFSHGFGVEVSVSMEQYFSSRDLTINEVLLVGKKVIFTPAAFEDLRAGILRPAGEYANNKKAIPGKIACKILRLAAQLESDGRNYTLINFPNGMKVLNREYERQRQRAKSLSLEIERKYIDLCAKNLRFEGETDPASSFGAIAVPKPTPKVFRSLTLRNELQRHRKHS